MIRIAGLLLIMPIVAVALLIANDGSDLSFVETLVAVFVIVGFAVTAVGWTVRHDV
jgi:L-cystine uptake protein TcyP (sodium:dicarboxylate symporter family)